MGLTVSDALVKNHVVTQRNKPTNWWGRKNAAPLKFDPKPKEAAFSAVFRTLRYDDRK